MSVIDLLGRLRRRGVQLRVEDDRLRLRAPKGALTAELQTELKERKDEVLAFLRRGSDTGPPPLEATGEDGPAPLSFAQQRLWFLDQLDTEGFAYNVPDVVRLDGRARVRLLEQAYAEVARRHDVLRTVFATKDDAPVQIVGAESTPATPLVDLSGLEPARRDAESLELARRERERRFHLGRGPLSRFTLLRLDRTEHLALVTQHHIVSDAWSTGILVQELGRLYQAFSRGRPSPLDAPPIQYADFSRWQRSWLSGDVLDAELAWWRKRLEGAPAELALPLDRPRAEGQSPRGGQVVFTLPPEPTGAVARLGQESGATPFMVLLAGFKALLARLSRQETIVTGIPVAGRNREEIEPLIGFFVNALVLPSTVEPGTSFRELLARVRESALGAFAHQDLPFEKLVEELRPERGPGVTPFFQVAFNMQNAPASELELEGLTLASVDVEGAEEKFDLTVVLNEETWGTDVVLRYKRALFDETTVRRMAGAYRRLLDAALADPDRELAELPLLTAAQGHQLSREWNDPHPASPEPTPVERFARHARDRPDAPALVGPGASWSYGRLADRARAVAAALQSRGVGRGDRVGFYLERSPDAVAVVLGIHWLGAGYVPLDPVYPAERVEFVLGDAGLSALVTTEELAAKLPGLPEDARDKILTLDALDEATTRSSVPETPRSEPDDLAYVIYTSGSTGRPKGVGVPHRNVTRLFTATDADFGFGPDDVWSLFHSLAFDFSVWELWGALAYGGRLLVVPPRDARSPDRFRALLAEHGVTVLNQTPSAFRQLIAADESATRELSLRWVVFGGEALEPESLRPWFDRHGDRKPTLVNMYGITETTVHVTFRPLSRADLESPASRIGAPIRDLTLHCLDGRGRPAPYGVTGELHVGGDGLSWGYLGRPALTAQRFVPDPWGSTFDEMGRGARLYRSGDLARRRPDGDVEYLGRLDHQVQLRGFRVELGEIETALTRHPAVREAVVLTRRDEATGDHVLWAWMVPNRETASPEGSWINDVRGYLKERLPEYMVPSALWSVEEIPLTAHGKVDRDALSALQGVEARPDLATEYTAPEGELETFLAGLMAAVVSVERIGRRDEFFELGGTSISGAVLINRLQKELDDIVQVVAIFDAPSVAELADYLRREHPDAVARRFPTETVERRATDRPRVTDADVAKFRSLVQPLGPAPTSSAPKNPPAVFVLAPPRSGTTLLRVMLGGHPRLFSPPELELLSFHTLRDREAEFGTERDRFWLEGLVRAVMEVEECSVEEAEAILSDMTSGGATAQETYAWLQERLGDRLLVDKTPSYALDREILERAEEIFDGAYYLHLLRHPYGMIASFEDAKLDQIFFRTEHGFDRQPLAEMIWRVSQENILSFLEEIPPERRLRLSFEDLVRGPEEQMRRVAGWLGLDFDPAMTRPYEDDRSRMTEGPHEESRMLGDVKFHQHRGIDPAIAERWRKKYDRDFLGDGTWELAEDLGYVRETGATPRVDTRIEPLVAQGETRLPLSFAQERLWFLDRLLPDGSVYNIPSAVRLTGSLTPALLEQAVDEIVRRHAVLRTVFLEAGDRPVQVIREPSRGPLPLVDLQGLEPEDRDGEARRLADAAVDRAFDLTRDRMLRLALVRLGADDHATLFTMHHVAGDGWSMGVLLREVARLVPSFGRGRPSALPEPPVQYADYAAWQRRWLESGVLDRELAYWKERLADAPSLLELPWDRPRPPVQSFRGRVVPLGIPAALGRDLRELTRDRGSTLYRTLLAAFQALLARLSNQDDVLVGSPVAGRDREEIEGLIGFFVNTLVLRTDLSGDPSFGDLLERVDRGVVEAFGRQNVPFERLVDELRIERNLSAAPLFQVMLTLQNTPLEPVELPGLRLDPWGAEASTAKFDLLLSMGDADEDGSLAGGFEYAVDLFDHTTVQRFASAFERLLEAVVEDPERSLLDVPLLGAAEAHQVRVEANDTVVAPPVPVRAPEARFADRVAESPDAVAVVHGDLHLSFGELDERVGRAAVVLRRLGVGPDVPVGLVVERGPEQIVGLLAAWRAGGAYVPLDPAHPEARVQGTIEDAGCPVVWTADDVRAAGSGPESGSDPTSDAPETPLDGLAYVIYTSGSTGVPKGVGVARRNVSHLVESLERSVYRDEQASRLRISVHAAWTFDGSVKQLVQILQGRTLVLEDEDTRLDARRLVDHLERHGVDVFDVTPSQLETLWDAGLGRHAVPRRVLVGGEAVSPALWQRLADHPGTRFVNVYGPTETTVDATAEPIETRRPGPSLGPALPDVRAYVLDRRGRPTSLGVVGELTLGGAGVSRGYLGRPVQTAERFVPDPFASGRPGDRLYRTGDLARRRRDGRIAYVGRGDHQVKVRGFRIELGEVEAALAALPGVREAAVVAPGEGGGRRLVAYLTEADLGTDLDVAELRRELAERLPEYMIPAVWTVLEELPLTSSGKVDRRALADRPLDAADLRTGTHVAPRNPTEEIVAGIWREVLEIDGTGRGIGVEDDFFDLGGHSLLATRVVSRMRRALDVDLPLRVLFETPTVAALALWAREARRTRAGSSAPPLTPLEPSTRRAGAALSFAQQRLWFLDRMQPGDPSYHMPNAVPMAVSDGSARAERFGQALTEVTRRHEALRTTFTERDHRPLQVVRPPEPIRLPWADLSGLEPDAGLREARELARREAVRPFDLASGPLARYRIVHLTSADDARTWLLVTLHHIVSDAWSNALLVREVETVRAAYRTGRPSPLAELPIQYADYAAWQRDWLSGETLEGELAWWRDRLDEAPAVLEMPTDRPRPPVRSSRGGLVPVRVPGALATEIRELARREGATPFITLLTAFQALLGRWSRQDDVVVGAPVAGRSRPEVENLIGFFVNTLALRQRVPGTVGFRPLLAEARRVVLETFEHQEVPFERLVEELVEERSTRHTPLFQVLFALQNAPGVEAGEAATGEAPDGAPEDDVTADVGRAKFDLTLVLSDGDDGGLEGVLEYAAELFDATTVLRLRERFLRLLGWVVEHPETPLERADLLPSAERHQLLREWNDVDTVYPGEAGLAALFAEQVARTPDEPAVVFGDEGLSYRELDERSARLARALRSVGVGVETRVAVSVDRSPAWVTALLAVVRAGGVYVPLDTSYPEERWTYMLEDAGVEAVLVDDDTREPLVRCAATVSRPLEIVHVESDPEDAPADSGPAFCRPDQAVYVIYTSGSTGRPKGVVVSQRNVIRLVRNTNYVDLQPGDRIAQISNASFDAATYEVWGALLNGGCLVGIPRSAILDPEVLVDEIRRAGIDSMFVTTALFNQVARQVPDGFSSVREVMFGGEASDPRAVARVLAAEPPQRLLHVFGPTESTTFTNRHRVDEVDPDAVTVTFGGPIANTSVWVADDVGEPVALGAVGELWIGGDGLARGYGGRPARTAVSYVPDPRGVDPGARAYRTGDLVRQRPEGTVDFVGRMDTQVKIRGFRIEPGEIEAVLTEHPEVSDAMVLVLGDGADRRLAAYVVSESVDAGTLRAFLIERLPGYMIPSGVAVLERFPVTPNGKVDRRALAALEPTAGFAEGDGDDETLLDPVEEILAGIFAEVLGRDRVGRDADFFELGGHSLLATQAMSRLRAALDVELPLAVLFEASTVAELAARVRRDRRPGVDEPPLVPLTEAERRTGVPLTFAQQRLWFLDRLDPGSVAYVIPEALRLSGTHHAAAWRQVFGEITRRHESLRTTFREVDEEPLQIVRAAEPGKAPLVDLSGLPGSARERWARRLAAAEASRSFDLESGPLVRFRWLRLEPDDHALLVTQHHIVSDGWSTGLLLRESGVLLDAYADGRPSPLPEPAVQYGDFAVWQRRWLQGDVLERQLAFWRDELAGSPGLLELPTDRPRPPVQTFEGRHQPVALPSALSDSLEALARREGATLFMLVLAGFQALLARWSGQDDVNVGSPIAGRTRRELEDLIGFFVNTLVLRTKLDGEPTLRDLLSRVRRTALAAYAHQDVPFERLVEELGVERNLSTTPLFQAMLVLQNAPTTEAADLPTGDLEPLQVEGTAAKFDLLLALAETDEGLQGTLAYNTDLFDRTTVVRWMAHFRELLAAAAANPDRPLAEIPWGTAAERHQVRVEWNDTGTGRPDDTLTGLVRAQAERTPEAEALVVGEDRWTYAELMDRVHRLARHLQFLGVGPEARVGVGLPRDADLVVAILAVLEAGGAYVPLDPGYPEERLAFIAEDAGVRWLVTRSGVLPEPVVMSSLLEVVDLERDAGRLAVGESTPLEPTAGPGNLAYLIYTSGSTGRPKGVAIEHRSAVELLRWARDEFSSDDLGGMLAATSVNFDLSVFELFLPLAWGGRVILAADALALPDLPARDEVRWINTVPSAMGELVRMEAIPPTVTTVSLAGEPLKRSLVDGVFLAGSAGAGSVQAVYNLYGPSEDTTYSTGVRVDRGPDEPTIGRPVGATRAWVVGRRGSALGLDAVGELCLSGAGLARGYLGRPARTAQSFVPCPFDDAPGARMYRTGDRARWLADGDLEFLGRLDHQVKVRGFRIEPGEIEAVLMRHAEVQLAAVPARGEGAERRLVAFYEGSAEPVALRSFLAERLPDHMVPSLFVRRDALPLTPNGKIDRKALAALDLATDAGPEAPGSAPPVGPTEELVAGIFGDVLGRGDESQIGRRDDFFGLGGHSLLATRVVARMRTVFGIELPLHRLFEGPTVAEVAAAVEASTRGVGLPALEPLPEEARRRGVPLSFHQRRLWFLHRLEPESTAYHVPSAVRLPDVSHVVLTQALDEIVRRHESLRTAFRERDGEPVQVVLDDPRARPRLGCVDLSLLGPKDRKMQAHRLAAAEERRPFDLARGRVARFRSLEASEDRPILLATFHHIVSDGWSLGVFFGELAHAARAFADGRPTELPDLEVQVGDVAVWQRSWLAGEVLESEIEYWRDRLRGAPPVLELPTDRPRPPAMSYRGGTVPVVLSAESTARLRALARQRGATLFMTLAASFTAFLSRVSGQDDVMLGTPVAGRVHEALEDLIGFFVNTLVLRADLSGRPSFDDAVSRMRKVALEAYEHQHVPFERLVEALDVARNLSTPPLFQALLVLQNAPGAAGLGNAGEPGTDSMDPTVEPLDVESTTAKYDLSLALVEDDETGEIRGSFEYAADLFDRTTVRRFGDRFTALLEAQIRHPERPVEELPWLAPEERHQVVVEWNEAAWTSAETTIPAMFQARAAETPEAPALVFEGGQWSYGRLDGVSAALASRLRDLGVDRGTPVAVSMERSPELVATLLAVTRAGGLFVPLDPSYPDDRLTFLLGDSQARVLVVDPATRDRLPEIDLPTLCLDGVDELDPDAAASESPVGPDDLAYLMYTSGSTGRPKGVAVPHRAVVRLVKDADFADLSAERTFLLMAPVSFDASTLEIWGPLLRGGRLAIHPPGLISPQTVREALRRFEVDTLWLTAALFHEIVDFDVRALAPLTQLLAGGDVLSPEHCRRVLQAVDGLTLIDGFGPTENTTFTTCWPMRSPNEVLHPVPVGRPIAGTEVRIVDPALRPTPLGVVGELVAGGLGLARGYWRRPVRTAESFVPDPDARTAGARLYRTGDLARWKPDGTVDFLGRRDTQVKIRGFRIEPGEIESVLTRHDAVLDAVVLAPGTGDARRLVAYLVPDPEADAPPTVGDLRDHLGRDLPEYMIPSGFVFLERFPRTPNDKVDRRALAALDVETPRRDVRPPASPTEEVLVGIWADVLGLDTVGTREDFFELGGHSLLATRVVARIRDAFGVDLPLQHLFEAPTVADLAMRLEQRMDRAPEPPLEPLSAAERRAGVPASPLQEVLWQWERREPDPARLLPSGLRLRGPLRNERMAQVLREVVRRHELLRTRFEERDGRLILLPGPVPAHPAGIVDLRRLAAADREHALHDLVRANASHVFRPEAPHVRAVIVVVGAEDHGLLLALHRLIADGLSMDRLQEEIASTVEDYEAGRPSRRPEPAVQYGDFAAWRRAWLDTGPGEAQLDFWRDRLVGAPTWLPLPEDRPRTGRRSGLAAIEGLDLGPELSRAVAALARTEGATTYMALLGAFAALLGRLAGLDVVIVGSMSAGRDRSETEELIGPFVNTLPIPVDLAGAPSFRELIRRVRDVVLGAFAHQDVPLEVLADELADQPPVHARPLVQVVFNLKNVDEPDMALGDMGVTSLEPERSRLEPELVFGGRETADGVRGGLQYVVDRFDAETIRTLLDRYVGLLDMAVESPDRPLRELSLPAPGESAENAAPAEGSTPSIPLRRPPLVPFRPEGSDVPWFFVHPANGEILGYAEIVRRLPEDCGAYGLQRPDVGSVTQLSVEDLADYYAGIVRRIRPAGPCRLAGWSAGAVLAVATARRLEDLGCEVDSVVLFDPPSPERMKTAAPSELELLNLFLRELHHEMPGASLQPVSEMPAGGAEAVWPRLLDALPPGLGESELQERYEMFRANVSALLEYDVSPGRAPLSLWMAEDGHRPKERAAAWRRKVAEAAGDAPEVEVAHVPGTHESMLRPPAVDELMTAWWGRRKDPVTA